MGAQDPAQRLSRRFLQGLAAPGIGAQGPPLEGGVARAGPVSFLLDTNVVSEWTKPRPNAGVVQWLEQVEEDEVFLSVVTFAELRQGIERLPAGSRRRPLDDSVRICRFGSTHESSESTEPSPMNGDDSSPATREPFRRP